MLSRGGCHCGKVHVKCDAPERLPVVICNRSICWFLSFLHVFVPHDAFRLLQGGGMLGTYRFGTATAPSIASAEFLALSPFTFLVPTLTVSV